MVPAKLISLPMPRFFHAVQVFCLCGVLLFLSACGSSQPKQAMYKEKVAPVQKVEPEKPKLSAQRLTAIRAHGLDKKADPSLLIGLSDKDVTQTLGTPNFVRRDKGVEIWQYKANGCILDLFLYKGSDGLSVDHTDLRGMKLDSNGEPSCFKRIVMGEIS